ncbi:hypothetical protein GTW69_25705, partial [Streptomyces sp. SID7760]|nr:hypothetical protein [Streptomyces sp. SID7760]
MTRSRPPSCPLIETCPLPEPQARPSCQENALVTFPPPPFGSAGEHRLQQHMGSADRAARFYDQQVRPCLTPEMREFIGRQSMVFLATADSGGACDSSFRAGPPGFVHVLDEHTLAYPEFRGNGVLASAGNMTENPHLGMLFVDFTHHRV